VLDAPACASAAHRAKTGNICAQQASVDGCGLALAIGAVWPNRVGQPPLSFRQLVCRGALKSLSVTADGKRIGLGDDYDSCIQAPATSDDGPSDRIELRILDCGESGRGQSASPG